jgi:hypothetical protein
MKIALLLSISLLFTLQLTAQQKVHFPDSNFYWNESHSTWPAPGGPEPYLTYIGTMYINSDTLIGNKTYLKLYKKFSNGFAPTFTSPPVYTSVHNLHALLFNDTANNKVYIKESDSSEILLYDFNLKVNDTFPIYPKSYFKSHYTPVVKKIDTVIDNNNVTRRRWIIRDINNNDSVSCSYCVYMIEGLGISSGIYMNADIIPCFEHCHDYVECYSLNDSAIYGASATCSFHQFVGIANHKKINLSISPNPAANYFDVKLNSIKNCKLYNSLQQTISIPYTSYDEYTRFDCSELKNGMYYLVTNNGKETYNGKILIMK